MAPKFFFKENKYKILNYYYIYIYIYIFFFSGRWSWTTLAKSQQSNCLFTLVKAKKLDMIEVAAMHMQMHAKFLTEYIFC